MNLKEFDDCVSEAARRTKATLGHSFKSNGGLRSHCAHCGRSDQAETKCQHDGKTLVAHLTQILMDNGTIKPGI